jgi:tRNA nucleotidyltransferase (CCA-adding enzyme)
MKEFLKKLPREIADLIVLAEEIATEKNLSAYLVGGCVRDLLLGEKNFDLDIVVVGEAISFADEFSRRLKVKVIQHRRFGTATVHPAGHPKVDFATSRKEYYPYPAALPLVSPSTLKDDLFRRDFTINAMAIDITRGNFGKLIDFFGGRPDLERGLIRVMHERSFVDDPTRILRAIRFEQRLGFRMEAQTLGYLQTALRQKALRQLAPTRITRELQLIFKEEKALLCLKRLNQLCGLKCGKDFFQLPLSALKWQARIQQG